MKPNILDNSAVHILLSILQSTPAIPILLVLMALDMITGLLAGFINKELSSSISFRGVIKKVSMLLVLGVAAAIDPLTPQVPEASGAALFFIGNEGLSVLENAAICGVPLPPIILESLAKHRAAKARSKVRLQKLVEQGKRDETEPPAP